MGCVDITLTIETSNELGSSWGVFHRPFFITSSNVDGASYRCQYDCPEPEGAASEI